MENKNKILLGLLILGLLLCGIGCGVMFGEFTALDYGGEYVYRTDTPETTTVELSLADCGDGDIQVNYYYYPLMSLLQKVTVDDTMEEGVLRIETTYDPDQVRPVFAVYPAGPLSEEDDRTGVLELMFSQQRSDLAVLLQMKKQILADLKDNTLRSYTYEEVFGLTITAAPETAARLKL